MGSIASAAAMPSKANMKKASSTAIILVLGFLCNSPAAAQDTGPLALDAPPRRLEGVANGDEVTTLYGNYNTSVSEFNFLELTARTSLPTSTVTGTIRLKSSVTGIATTQPFSFSLDSTTGASRRQDIAIHGLLRGFADFGEIKITHDGAPGQLSARVSQYDVTSVSPLDFTLVGQDVCRRGTSGR